MPFNHALITKRIVADYTVSILDDLIEANTAAGAVAVTLPSVGASTALNYVKHEFDVVKTTSDANAVTISVSGGALINGAASFTLSAQYDCVHLRADDQGGYTAVASRASSTITTLTTGAIVANDSSLGIDGQAAAQGGAIVLTGGVSSTTGNAGGAVSAIGGAGTGTGAGAVAALTGGASGAGATGKGGAAKVTGGAALSTNADGGGAVVAGGAKAGSGFIGPVVLGNAQLMPIWYPQAAPASDGGDTPFTATVAQLIAGLISMTPTTGRAITTPTGAELDAGVAFADVPATFGFDFTVQNRAAFAATDDIITLTAGATGVTITGTATVAPGVAGRFRAVRTTTATWIIYKIAG